MRLVRAVLSAIIILVSCHTVTAQDHRYSISISGSYTTSSELFYNPDTPEDFLRSLNYSLDHIFGYGFDLRRNFPDLGVQVGISAEVISTRNDVIAPDQTTGASTIVVDGFTAVPVELSGYFRIPFSSDAWEMFMGGGGGVYFGNRYYEQAGVVTSVTGRTVEGGIHVISELQYNFQPSIGARLGVKFRNVQFRSTNMFTAPVGIENGQIVHLSQTPFTGLVNIDGMEITLGFVYMF